MSLLRLLTAGKSLVGLQRTASRYQMRDGHRLPKFGSTTNPFAAPAPKESAQAGEAATQKSPARPMSPAERAAARLKETKKLPTHSSAEPRPLSAPRSTAPVSRGKATRWAQKLNPLSWWPRRQPQPKPAIPRFTTAPVQGELSLDRVKVVRNDLNEADVEIITARAESKPQPPAPARRDETMALLKT